jgi:hypothetical protein
MSLGGQAIIKFLLISLKMNSQPTTVQKYKTITSGADYERGCYRWIPENRSISIQTY